MFTFSTATSLPPFIRQQQTGWVTHCDAVKVCLVQFERNAYHPALFAQLAVAVPDALNRAGAKRCADYLAGRYAAQQLLQQAGCTAHVTMGSDRAPIWPDGWRGTISHASHWAMAVLAPEACHCVPGVDIETLRPAVMRNIADMFTTPAERARLAQSGLPPETALLIVFSAKESVFKALYPRVQRFFDFQAAELCELDPLHHRFTLRLTQSLAPSLPVGHQLTGNYLLYSQQVITLILADA